MDDSLFSIVVPLTLNDLDDVYFSDYPPSRSPSIEDSDDNSYIDTEEEFIYHLTDSQNYQIEKNKNKEINEINDKLKTFYSLFTKYCKVEKITKEKFMIIREEFSTLKQTYDDYANDLKDRAIYDPDNPVVENCPLVLEIPIIKSQIESINKIVNLIQDTFSKIYILKIMNK